MRVRKPRVLLVERDTAAVRALLARLRGEPWQVQWVRDDEAAHNVIDAQRVDALIAAVRAPRLDGLSLLRRTLRRHPDARVVLLGDGADLERGIAALRQGAADFVAGPVVAERLVAALRRGFEEQATAAALQEARSRLDERFGLDRIAARSPAMHRVVERAAQVASARSPVLIEGEPGTGKRTLAQCIHQAGPRRNEAFAWVACDALAAEDAEAELLGVAAGDEGGGEPGAIERAEGGTLFLDEVASLPPPAQAALLGVLHDQRYVPPGGGAPRRTDVRLIAASDRDLAAEVAAGRFRADLHERLAMVRLALPPLRERAEDLPGLVTGLVDEIGRERGRRVAGVTRGTLERLAGHDWPGNVRELRNALDAAVASHEGRGPLVVSDLPPPLRARGGARERLEVTVGMTVGEVEHRLIAATLEHARGDKKRAAALLGIGLRTLYRKIREYGLG